MDAPVIYHNWGPDVTTPPWGNLWSGLVTAEDEGHWTYDRRSNTHHFICQSVKGEIQHTVLVHWVYIWLTTMDVTVGVY